MTWKELIEQLASGRHNWDPEALEKSHLGLKKYAAIARDYRHHNGGYFVGRMPARDTVSGTAILGRMLAGFAGDVARAHPVSIEPCLIDSSAPPLLYGQGVVVDPTTEGVRPIAASGDTALTDVYGVTVRPFPQQQNSASPAFGNSAPPTSGIIGVMTFGYIMIGFNKSGSAPVKGAQAYIWDTATAGADIAGGWETASTSSILIGIPPRTCYQGGWDANYVGELKFHV